MFSRYCQQNSEGKENAFDNEKKQDQAKRGDTGCSCPYRCSNEESKVYASFSHG
jgi:hypothetical protein